MTKFGRFEFGKQAPAETYEGDYMKLDAKGYVSIFRNEPSTIMGVPTTEPRLIMQFIWTRARACGES